MKVLRVIASMDPAHGGPSQGIRNSIPALEPLGVYNEVLCFDAPGAPYLANDPFVVHAVGPAKGPYAYCPGLRPWLLEHLHRFDAVIIHGLWLYNSYGTYQAFRIFRKRHGRAPKLFVMPHGMLDPYFQKAPGRKLKAIRNRIFWHFIERHVVNQAHGVLFTCQQELLLARETFASYKPKLALNAGYGIQAAPSCSAGAVEHFRAACSIPSGQPYWLFLSRIHKKKGVDLLVRAYQKLLHETHALPPLVIAGPGLDSAYGKELLELAKPSPRIVFPGMLTGQAKWGALYGCEVFILPSHQENFGIAIAEAMACGKPVLISDKVNIWREIDSGSGGIVARDTAAGVYTMLRTWHELNEAEKRDMALAAKDTFERKFTVAQAAKTLFNALNTPT